MASTGASLESFMAYFSTTSQRLDLELAKISWLNHIQSTYRVPRLLIFALLFLGAFSFLFLGFGASLFTTLIGCAYPIYASFKAIESTGKQDDTQWLMYWVVFACFSVFETCVDFILTWIPFFYAIKVAFLLYCQLPMFRGAEFLYRQFVRPVFLRHQAKIEQQFARLDGARTAIANVIGVDPLAAPSPSQAAGAGALAPGDRDPQPADDLSVIFGGSNLTTSSAAASSISPGGAGSAGSGKRE